MRCLVKLKDQWSQNGLYPSMGDCGNIAEALQSTYGGKIYCSYEDEFRWSEGEPAHCALKIGDKYYDAHGEISLSTLRYHAITDEMSDEEYEELTIVRPTEVIDGKPAGYESIRDEDTIEKVKGMIRRVCN